MVKIMNKFNLIVVRNSCGSFLNYGNKGNNYIDIPSMYFPIPREDGTYHVLYNSKGFITGFKPFISYNFTKDEVIEVKHNNESIWYRRYFKEIRNGKVVTYRGGASSLTCAEGLDSVWDKARKCK